MKSGTLNHKQLSLIARSPLFKNLDPSSLPLIFQHLHAEVRRFPAQALIASEGDPCTGIGIVLGGSIDVKKIHLSGKETTITEITPSETFGEVIIFSDHKTYPSALISQQKTTLLFISEEEILRLCRFNHVFLKNLMGLLSNKVLMMSDKVRILSYDRLRQRIASYLIGFYHKTHSSTFTVPHNRQEMADYLSMPRPSLSRELKNMKTEGLISYRRNQFTLINPEKLELII